MPTTSPQPTIDPAIIAAVAREVIQRLKANSQDTSTPPMETSASKESLVTLQTLQQYAGATEILVSDHAVITPAAKEEAAAKGIQFRTANNNGGVKASDNESTPSNPLQIQLDRRGVQLPDGVEVIWTDRPASEVHRNCCLGNVAAMVSCIADVDRFANELSPTHWVLDSQKLNLIAAVNTAAKIAQVTSTGTAR